MEEGSTEEGGSFLKRKLNNRIQNKLTAFYKTWRKNENSQKDMSSSK